MDGNLSLAEVNFVGPIEKEIVASFQGGYMEVDKQQVLVCECRALGCNGEHFPGYLVSLLTSI
jgi:hypothetical protein